MIITLLNTRQWVHCPLEAYLQYLPTVTTLQTPLEHLRDFRKRKKYFTPLKDNVVPPKYILLHNGPLYELY